MSITTILILCLVVLFLIGTPLFTIIGGLGVLCSVRISGLDPSVMMEEMYRITSLSALIAIPLFVFAGYYLAETKLPHRMLNFFEVIAGWLKAGVCLASFVSTAIFSAFSGASGVTIVTFGGLIQPMLKEKGYSDKFTYGLITASGGPGILLIPSIAVILYGVIANVSIQGLFAACLIPAVLLIIAQYSYALIVTYKADIPTKKLTWKESLKAVNDIKYEIPMFLIVVIGVLKGFISPAEAAVVTVVYALIVEGLILREVKWSKVPSIVTESMQITGAILLIMGVALGFTNFLVDHQVPAKLVAIMQESVPNKYMFLLALNGILLIVGCMMDVFSAILVVVPLIVPISQFFGIDPFHLGVIFLVNLEIGYLTPPVGLNLFLSSLRFNRPMLNLFVEVLPFLIFMVAVLLLVTYIPFLSIKLVDIMGLRLVF